MEEEIEGYEELEEFDFETFVGDEIDFDFDYEFDAPMFYPFTRPETEQETMEAQRWFEFARSYPPSPFVVKLNRQCHSRAECASVELEDGRSVHRNFDDRNVSDASEINSDYIEVKLKSSVMLNLQRSSTLMKPTASYLAKQAQPRGIHSSRLVQRFQLSLGNSTETSSQRSSLNDSHAIKRQKLDGGYLCKAPHLKRQTSLLHKVPKKAGYPEVNSVVTRIKTTIPKAPNLETALRAQRSKVNLALAEDTKSDSSNFKARPLNRKILKAPTLIPRKKSVPQMPNFQVFHLKTSERATQHLSQNVVKIPCVPNSQIESTCIRRPSPPDDTKQEKCEKSESYKALPLDKIFSYNEESGVFLDCKDGTTISGEFNCLAGQKRFSDEPPTELLSNLSITSEYQKGTKLCKMHLPNNCSKEKLTGNIDQEHGVY